MDYDDISAQLSKIRILIMTDGAIQAIVALSELIGRLDALDEVLTVDHPENEPLDD